jgi:hypothetical protein
VNPIPKEENFAEMLTDDTVKRIMQKPLLRNGPAWRRRRTKIPIVSEFLARQTNSGPAEMLERTRQVFMSVPGQGSGGWPGARG